MGVPLNLVSCVYKGAWNKGWFTPGSSTFHEAFVGAILLGFPLVSIGSLASATEKLGNGRPSTDG
jgi:hypothetical protein